MEIGEGVAVRCWKMLSLFCVWDARDSGFNSSCFWVMAATPIPGMDDLCRTATSTLPRIVAVQDSCTEFLTIAGRLCSASCVAIQFKHTDGVVCNLMHTYTRVRTRQARYSMLARLYFWRLLNYRGPPAVEGGQRHSSPPGRQNRPWCARLRTPNATRAGPSTRLLDFSAGWTSLWSELKSMATVLMTVPATWMLTGTWMETRRDKVAGRRVLWRTWLSWWELGCVFLSFPFSALLFPS